MGSTRSMCIGFLAVLASLGIRVPAVRGQSPAKAVEDLLSYHVEGGARWRQDNPAFEPGSGVPAYWVRQLRWGPSREVVLADAFAVSEGGSCAPVAHMVYYWDVQNRRVAVNSFSAGGVRGEGYLEAKGRSGTQLMTTITLPDGSSLQIREYSDNSRPDTSTTYPERLVDGAWVTADSVAWRRDEGGSPCG